MAADLSSLKYVQDEQGEALLVSKEGWQVMMEWEKPYMEACVAALALGPKSDVLEIGFGMAYSSNKIQSYGVRSHTIIECSPEVLKRLRSWKSDMDSKRGGVAAVGDADGDTSGANRTTEGEKSAVRSGIRIVEGLWQLCLPELGKFDAVFMDDYPVGNETFRAELQKRFPAYADLYFGAPSKWEAFVDMCLNWHLRPGGRIGGYMVVPKYPTRADCTAYMFPYEAVVSKACKYVSNNQPRGFASVMRSNTDIIIDKSNGRRESPVVESQASPVLNGKDTRDSPGSSSSQQATRSGSTVRTMVIPKIIFTPQNATANSSTLTPGCVPPKKNKFRSHAFNHKVVVSNADEALKAFQLRQAKRKAKEVARGTSSDGSVAPGKQQKTLSRGN